MAEEYTIREGDCVMLIAQERGFLWQTLWQHPNNQKLAAKRSDPNVVMPGDVLHIPDLGCKEEQGATETKHTFRLKSRPGKLRLKLTRSVREEDTVEHAETAMGEFVEPTPPQPGTEPEADAPYVLYVDGTSLSEGRTDAEGMIEESLPFRARKGRLVLYPGEGTRERTVLLNLGHMDPIDEIAGVCKRLSNLGYACPADAQEGSAELAEALQAFQRDHGLDASGEADEPTRAKLKEVHGA